MAGSQKHKCCNFVFFLGISLLALFTGPSCSGDYITGIWVRVTSIKIKIKEVKLRIYSEDSTQQSPLATQTVRWLEPKTLDPESEDPKNQLWILVTAKKEYKDKAISIKATGLRDLREVAYGSLDGLQFIPDKIIEATTTLDLTHSGSDEDEDGFYVPEDCDDHDPSVHPEAKETCDDGLDNNCNGTTDEGCPCEAGTSRECWPHWAGEIKGGPCTPGTQECNGTWGPCKDAVLPNPESCPNEQGDYNCFSCTNGIDDDCDGFVDTKDTDCGGCVVDTWEACFTGPPERRNHGICRDGQKRCVDGSWGICEGEVLPNGCNHPTEPGQQAVCNEISEGNLCDGRDNDCDEIIDNVTIKQSCSRNCGVCSGAKQKCVDGKWVDCSASDYAEYASDPKNITRCNEENPPLCCSSSCYVSQETTDFCDDLDNDCDCVVDNAVDDKCICNNGAEIRCPDRDDPLRGICKRGVSVCENGSWVDHDCQRPETELCDGLDNNCDGTIDQHPEATADCMQYRKPHTDTNTINCVDGICRWECEDGFWDLNNDRYQPGGSDEGDGCEYECTLDNPPNELCDGRDNDCDGLTDGDDQVNIDVLCPARAHSTRTRCEGPYNCDYTCTDPFEDCNGDLDRAVSMNYDGDGCEKNLSSDRENCGGCGNVCGDNEICSAGQCSCGGTGPDCDDTPTNYCCGTHCVDTLTDESNCGECGNTCTNNHGSNECVSGVCSPSCDPGYGDCDGNPNNGCEAYLWNTSSCGTDCYNMKDCSTELQNASGQTCSSGSCDYSSCSSSFADCDSNRTNGCEENIWEPSDCGTNCFNRVDCTAQVQHANNKTCSSGHCSYSSCQDGYDNCNNNTSDGCEENIWEISDCGTNCNNRVNCNTTVLHATGLLCSSGHCDYTNCQDGYADCNGYRSDGCETYIWATGSCGTTCQNRRDCNDDVHNALGIYCNSGSCDYSSCTGNWGDCNGGRTDGCETDLNTTTAHCGTCNFACVNPNGSTSCISGICTPSCNNGSADCDGHPENGCEKNIWQLTSCSIDCSPGADCTVQIQNATGPVCSSGHCDYSSCNNGYKDCNSIRTDGCERDIWQTTDCGDECSGGVNCTATIQNATGISCDSGTCSFSSCTAGYANCDNDPLNGCEEDIWQTTNCGGADCTTVDCNTQVQNATGISCSAGSCTYSSCSSSQWGDCNSIAADGCEKDLWQDSDCGTDCNNGVDCSTQVLHATGASCFSGSCTYTSCVSSQYADCNTFVEDGCEVDLLGDTTCGPDCFNLADCTQDVQHAVNPHCDASGSCTYDSCVGSWDNCNGDTTDGCEADLSSNPNCGSCGNDCSSSVSNKACVFLSNIYVCGCNSNEDCGDGTPACNGGQCE